MITAERLRELLDYNPETGDFTWRVKKARVRIGDKAGCIAKRKDKEYLVIRVDQNNYYAHRLAFLWMTGEFPNELVDHNCSNGLDNRWETIRACSTVQNSTNKVNRGSNNTSGFLGVFPSHKGLWTAQVTIHGQTKTIGTFDTAELAARARDAAAKELHGEFAFLNFNDGILPPNRPIIRRDSKNKYRGVVYIARVKRFVARVCIGGRSTHLGYFDTEEEAARVRDDAARIVYGEKAVLNFP